MFVSFTVTKESGSDNKELKNVLDQLGKVLRVYGGKGCFQYNDKFIYFEILLITLRQGWIKLLMMMRNAWREELTAKPQMGGSWR